MERGAISSVIRKIHIKMTVRHHNKPTRMTKIKTTEPILNVDEDGEQLELSDTAMSINLYNHFRICRHYDLAISLSQKLQEKGVLTFPKRHFKTFQISII